MHRDGPSSLKNATQVCYLAHMKSVTSSFRISNELQQRLAEAAKRTGETKNAILMEALTKHLDTLDHGKLAAEARRQSELVSRHEQDESWYGIADTAGWK
jgi:predicted DNA-binding protein